MTTDLFGLDPAPGVDAPAARDQLLVDAAAFATELRECTQLADYSAVVQRVLTHPVPGLLFALVPGADPDGQPERLGAVIASTRHRLNPTTVPDRAPLPGYRFPRRTR